MATKGEQDAAMKAVKAVHEHAECFNIGNQFCGIFSNCEDEKPIGTGSSESAAWIDASSRLALSHPGDANHKAIADPLNLSICKICQQPVEEVDDNTVHLKPVEAPQEIGGMAALKYLAQRVPKPSPQAEPVSICNGLEAERFQIRIRSAVEGHSASQPSDLARTGKVFDELWREYIQDAEVEPSPEEEGFARWGWNMASGDYANGYIDGREAGYHSCGSCSHAWEAHDGECGAYMPDGSICGCTWVKSQGSQPVIEPLTTECILENAANGVYRSWFSPSIDMARELQQHRKAQQERIGGRG